MTTDAGMPPAEVFKMFLLNYGNAISQTVLSIHGNTLLSAISIKYSNKRTHTLCVQHVRVQDDVTTDIPQDKSPPCKIGFYIACIYLYVLRALRGRGVMAKSNYVQALHTDK